MISVILNVDSRQACPEFQGMWKGVRSRDFLGSPNLINKRNFFKGHDIELIVFVDEHESLTEAEWYALHTHADCVVVRKHSKHYRGFDPYSGFNDINFLQALFMSRGSHIAHFDGDMAAFSADPTAVAWMLDEVDSGRSAFVSYPSVNSPAPCHAPEYNSMWWASTRFFLCKRETLQFDVLERALRDPQWMYETYSRPPRENPWLEQFLGILGNYKVLYPPPNINSWAVFPWMRYTDGTLDKLNGMSHADVAQRIFRAGGDGIFHDGVDSNLMGL